jgi:hypothetical protein
VAGERPVGADVQAGAASASSPDSVRDAAVALPSRSAQADVLILGHDEAPAGFLGDLQRAARSCGVAVALGQPEDLASVVTARALIVLGEPLARRLGASVPAQRQNEMTWVVSTAPAEVSRDPAAKQALWGELKRLARILGPVRTAP